VGVTFADLLIGLDNFLQLSPLIFVIMAHIINLACQDALALKVWLDPDGLSTEKNEIEGSYDEEQADTIKPTGIFSKVLKFKNTYHHASILNLLTTS